MSDRSRMPPMLPLPALAAVVVVAVAHVGFMVLEAVLWTTPTGRRIFGQTSEQAETTKVLAQNQGVYNGALAALLLWFAFRGDSSATLAVLAFVVVVGIYGGFTAKKTILLLQAAPAVIAMLVTLAVA